MTLVLNFLIFLVVVMGCQALMTNTRWWRRRQRQVDMQMLWPQLVHSAPSLAHAKAGIARHIFNDTAWTQDFDHDELTTFIDNLRVDSSHAL